MFRSFGLHPFIQHLRCHPGYLPADRELIANAEAHPAYCLASRACLQLYRHPSRAPAQQWNVYGFCIGLRQRRALLCRGALCSVLIRRLMRFQGKYGIRNTPHHVCCVISRRHFLVSKNAAEMLFQEGLRLYGEQRYSEAAKNWGQAALLKHGKAHAYMSRLLSTGGKDVKTNAALAFEFASYGAMLNCAHSKGALSYCFVNGLGTPTNIIRGLVLANESANAGSSFGQFVLGSCLASGLGGTRDTVNAVRMLKLAGMQGDLCAQLNLGVMLNHGVGVAQDYDEAVRWLKPVAAQGHAYAQYALGVMYEKGRGVNQDNAEAVRLYRLAAAQGQAEAKEKIADMMRHM